MQYILTTEEYEKLVAQARLGDTIPNQVQLQRVCTLLADSYVLTEGWAKGQVWGCILTSTDNEYCDQCPALDVCPHKFKEWSK